VTVVVAWTAVVVVDGGEVVEGTLPRVVEVTPVAGVASSVDEQAVADNEKRNNKATNNPRSPTRRLYSPRKSDT
jgi:hypothetical protein